LASRHQKGKRRKMVPKRWPVVVVLTIVLILATFVIVIDRGSLHGGQVGGGERSKGVLIERRCG
jgi:hypothetical protein